MTAGETLSLTMAQNKLDNFVTEKRKTSINIPQNSLSVFLLVVEWTA